MRRRGGRLVGAAVLLLVAACSSGGPEAVAPSPTGTPSSVVLTEVITPEPTEAAPPPPTITRNPLADLVEGIELDDEPVLGSDISWPQCPPGMGIPQKRSNGGPGPVAAARYVIVGLTNGPGFYPNPCLVGQVDDTRRARRMIAAYAVASYPEARFVEQHGQTGPYDGATLLGALANTGYQQAKFNVRSMKAAGLLTPIVWIDVEPVPDFAWSGDLVANASVVAGIARGYQDAGYAIGVYSTPLLWSDVVGDLELGVPEWRAAGQTSSAEALSRCGDDWRIQGGDAVLGQWVQDDRDMNLTCPGISADLSAWFHQY